MLYEKDLDPVDLDSIKAMQEELKKREILYTYLMTEGITIGQRTYKMDAHCHLYVVMYGEKGIVPVFDEYQEQSLKYILSSLTEEDIRDMAITTSLTRQRARKMKEVV